MKKTFFTYSFGCRVNQAEIEEINKKMINSGYDFSPTNPDIYIINTCAVTRKAENEVNKLIRNIKKNIPNTKIVALGCAATYWQNNNKLSTSINLIVDNHNKDLLVDLIKNKFNYTPEVSINGFLQSKYLSSRRIILKIQDGCNRFCTYCIVPHLRGRPRSIILPTIVDKIKRMEKDINEVILTAINSEAYGIDTGETLTGLIRNILQQTNIKRLSLGSINPWSINGKFLKLYKDIANLDRFVDYFHIPVQSGSNKILDLMKRGYSVEELHEKFSILHKIYPNIFFGTDVIVGFLEEGEREFEETYKFLNKSPIAKFHVFRYSPRSHTAAYYLAKTHKEPSEKVKMARSHALIELGKKKYHEFQNKLIGQSFKAMFIKPSKHGFQEALLENQMSISVKVPKDIFGEIKKVKITSLKKNKLLAILYNLVIFSTLLFKIWENK